MPVTIKKSQLMYKNPSTAGTIEEHCIDTFCLDKDSKTIYMKRLGVGTDRSISYA